MTKKILIGQLGSFGDCLYATTIAKQLKHDYPDCHITWAISSKFKSILELNPHIDEIWEVDGTNTIKECVENGWHNLKAEAIKRKKNGLYDELIFSQMANNWKNFDGTIRSTILRSCPQKITVDVSPVIILSDTEINNVKLFAEKNQFHSYKHVILFECSPQSKQSSVNIQFALQTANDICAKHKNICFILSSQTPINSGNNQIIDASSLSFRENAELSKYCTLLIGCSSGISWLCTSDWAKKINTIQIISRDFFPFPGMAYDFKLWGLDGSNIIEFYDNEKGKLHDLLEVLFNNDFGAARLKYHKQLEPEPNNLARIFEIILQYKYPFHSLFYIYFNVYFNILKLNRHIHCSSLAIAFVKNAIINKKLIIDNLQNIILPYDSRRFNFFRKLYGLIIKKNTLNESQNR